MKRGFTTILIVIIAILCSVGVFAAEEISLTVDRLNYWDAENHTFTITNNGATPATTVYNLPAGWSNISTTGGCAFIAGPSISCNLAASASGTFTLESPGTADTEYQLTVFSPANINESGWTEDNNVTVVRIAPGEVFHTLVEFGRGRGNYLYDSGSSRSGSGKSRPGCEYLPNGTMFELNFLHKVHNIQQYLGLPDAEGENATFSCSYSPNVSVVRKHLITSIARTGTWDVDYSLPEVLSSWERMGYVGMDYDPADVPNGTQIIANCTSLDYALPAAYGNVKVDNTEVVFTVTDREPFTIDATATGTTLGNGTQEVEITYTITNTAPLALDNIVIELQAPQYADFIGTRGELWGTALDTYRLELIDIAAGGTETVTLVARFDTAAAAGMTSLELSGGAQVQFTPCWEINAYNPGELIQTLVPGGGGSGGNPMGNITVNMSVNSTIINIITYIENIYTIVNDINITLDAINTTIDNIWDLALYLNESIQNISYNVWNYENRTLTFYPATSGSGGGGVACSWNTTRYYNASNTLSTNYTLVYGDIQYRTDFNNIYSGAVDAWQYCHRTAPQAASDGSDVLEIYICNDYDGSGNPHDEAGCTLIDSEDPTDATWTADHLKWECDSMLAQEITGENLSVLLKCDGCNNTADAWLMASDLTTVSTNTYNSSDNGTSWSLSSYEALVDLQYCLPIDYGAEVWTYYNRTLTDYNFTDLLNQFDCINSTGGVDSDANLMCELLFAINVTTTNTWNTIIIINDTVVDINSTVYWVRNNTEYIIDQLDCDGTSDTPICDYVSDINSTVTDIETTVTNINSTVNNINASIYLMNQSIMNYFDDLNLSLHQLINFTLNLELIMNCSEPLVNISPENDTICHRLDQLQTNVSDLMVNVSQILDLVVYINGTRWGNYSAIDIINAINNMSVDTSEILEEIYRMREFNEELVFLVTDSIVLQKEAGTAMDRGDFVEATTKLAEANDRLKIVSEEMANQERTIREEQASGASSTSIKIGTGWWLPALIIVMIVILGLYLFSRPKDPYADHPDEQQPRY